MVQVTLAVCVSGTKNSFSKDSDSIKLKFGILSSLASSWYCFSVGVVCGLGYLVYVHCMLQWPPGSRSLAFCSMIRMKITMKV